MKNIKNSKGFMARMIVMGLLMVTSLWGCKEDMLEMSTTSDVNMMGYLEANTDQFSNLVTILEKTGNAGFLAAYGSYTMFAPTNEAFAVFLQDKGVASVDQLDVEELKRIVRFHLIEDTISTSTFTDGKLPRVTMLGQYVITGSELVNGVSRTRVNRQANVVRANIKVGNGIVHTIDRVLQPATRTVAEMLESNPEYSIFTMALKETGLFNQLNKMYLDEGSTQRAWYTVIAQKDEVYRRENINSYEDLKKKYSQGDPKDPKDKLYSYMAYRILTDSKYLADLVTSPSHETLAPQEVITSKLKGEQVLINEDVFNGVLEEGAPVNRASSDNTATNGVIHSVTQNYEIKVRNPVLVNFDLADQPEIRILPNWRKPGAPDVVFPFDAFSEIKVEGNRNFTYKPGTDGDSDGYAFRDGLWNRISANTTKSMEFTTPTLVKGRYKVWVGMRYLLNSSAFQVQFNGQPLPRVMDFKINYPGGVTEREALAQGVKRYTLSPGNVHAKLAGTITVETTGRHKLKFVGLDTGNGEHRMDLVQFIPEDMDQLWPKFAKDGTLVYE